MGIYIDKGVNVDASWVNHIAVSSDGINWSTINIHALDVKSRYLNLNNDSPLTRGGSHGMITISTSDSNIKAQFDPNDVLNQPTWLGNTPAKLQKAVADITGWLN
ncbi:MAG: hypothetical protein KAJ19_25805 [Gammaproteobacteria bacterium]|nr:hypothetical protein [Gammaproteobacteria bacterium]